MSSASDIRLQQSAHQWMHWIPILAGFSLLFLPIYKTLFETLWRQDEYAHAPLVGLITVWLIYEKFRHGLPVDQPRIRSGAVCLLLGLVMAMVGRVLGLPVLSMAAQPPVIAGIVLFMIGLAGLRMIWFPLVFLLFMIPLPGFLLELLTGWLKILISEGVENALYLMGFPVSRQGVVILIGQYRLFLADACSGLYSMMALFALGSLYIYRVSKSNPIRAIFLLLSIFPLAVAANGLRVFMVVLCTYWFGDITTRALHALFGLSVFVLTLLSLSLLNHLLSGLSHSENADPISI